MAFEYFVVLAEMRTGSNLLESNLNAFEGVTCHGELFNPSFINDAGTSDYMGVTFAQREENPWSLLNAIRAGGQTMAGFRLFHDHDPRIWDHVLNDRACAKIVLTRNPLDSYVSRKIATETKQWKLGDVKNRRETKVHFDADEFQALVTRLQATQVQILNTLQTTGQTAFYIGYDDLNDLSVLNGLSRWLGVPAQIDRLPRTLKKQNPGTVAEKLMNPEALRDGLSQIDWLNLGQTPNFEVRRAPMLDACVGGQTAPVLFLPMRGGPESEIADWIAAFDGVKTGALPRNFDAARLREWRAAHPGARSFTVVSDPLLRAHRVFCQRILSGQIGVVREHMNRLFDAKLPDPDTPMSAEQHRAAFKAYLRFVQANLSGQTGLLPWPAWASQAALLQDFAAVLVPDLVLREETLGADLAWLAGHIGMSGAPEFKASPDTAPYSLSAIVDDEIRGLCKSAYARDYEAFGFR